MVTNGLKTGRSQLSIGNILADLLILCPFKDSALNTQLSPALSAEFQRLKECAEKTNLLQSWPNQRC